MSGRQSSGPWVCDNLACRAEGHAITLGRIRHGVLYLRAGARVRPWDGGVLVQCAGCGHLRRWEGQALLNLVDLKRAS